MKLSRGLGLLATLGVCWLSAVGCDDGTNTPADGNDASSESGGSAGKGTGGSAGKGTGGSAGKGTGGSAGKGTGGSSGSAAGGGGGVPPATGGGAGKGGKAGGSSAGAGGAGTGGAGGPDGGGAAGADGGTVDASVDGSGTPDAAEAGRDGSHGGTGAKSCTYGCATDDDCVVDGDPTMKCHPTKKRCVDPTSTCETNDDCVGFVSFWSPSCFEDADCQLPGDVCVESGIYGLCASPPDPVDGCLFPGTEPTTRKRFGTSDGGTPDGGAVVVCGATSGRCNNGVCVDGCSSDPNFCTSGGGFGETCNETSGMCECAASSECTTSGVSACNQQNHRCECVTNADCTSPGFDTCVAGSCGCSNASACPTSPYKNAVSVCD
jgi:hypothetical protein